MAAPIVQNPLRFLRRRWWLFATPVVLVALYAAAGFWLVPYLAKSSIEKYVQQDLSRRATIGKVTFNPFTLTAEIGGFALNEPDGTKIASFDLLHVNAEAWGSISNGAWTFTEVRLDKPDLSVIADADGTINFARLVPPKPANAPPTPPAGMPQLRIGTFAVHDGRARFDDRGGRRARPFSATLMPIEFTLTDFRTAPDFQNVYRFEGSTVAGERITWSGQFSVRPLGSAGRFAVMGLKAITIAEYLGDALPFALPTGSLDVEGDYRVAVSDTLGLTVGVPKLTLRDIGIAPRGGGEPWIAVPSVEISGTSLSLAERKLAVDRVQVDGAKLVVWREPDGTLNLPQLFAPRTATPAAPASAAPTVSVASATPGTPAAPAAAKSNWSLSVATIDVRGSSVDVEDRAIRPAVRFQLAPVALTVSGYTADPANPLKVLTNIGINGKGTVTAEGDVKLSPMTANLAVDLRTLELPPLQPYLSTAAALQLISGQLSVKGKVAFAAEPAKGESGMQLSGDVTVANLTTRDTATRQDFVKWQQLQLTGIDYRQGPDRLSINRIEARRPYGRIVIGADQTLNVASVMKPAPATPVRSASANAATRGAARPAAAPSRRAPAPMPVRIRTVVIQDGSANFADMSVQPNFAAAILSLAGTVTGLSSDPNSRAQVKLTGSVDRFAPVDISGTVNLLSATAFSDIALNFRNMELTTFNPYSGRYAGYNISKGKLTTELHYKVENRALDAQHHVVLDQLEFGDATDSKEAVPLPVKLAVSLLKDRNGVIDVNLPVSGSLDDPQFRMGPLIWQAIFNLLEKIVTAPFALLGSLFGGGEELAYIDFAAGSAVLAPEQNAKISMLAEALASRPELKLDIPLQTLSPEDDAALSKAAFDTAVDGEVSAAAAAPPPSRPGALARLYQQQFGTPEPPPSPSAPRLAGLTKVYQEQFGMPPAFPVSATADADPVASQIDFLEDALRAKFAASEADREALARARADAVQSAILANSQVAPERVFLSERTSDKVPDKGTARMELNLQ